jgi:diguanylate cyclase (GGDEF)-like protein/putative nucleotidyltransferase with HDIG domain
MLVVAAFALLAGRRTGEGRGSDGRRWHLLLGGLLLLVSASLRLVAESWPSPSTALSTPTDVLLLAGSILLVFSALLARNGSPANQESTGGGLLDPLTQMTDHRGFQDRLSHECERAYRFGDTFALLLVDLDDFQLVNNRYGHRTGDRLLMELASRLRPMVREIDLCARFGGDQFALVLPHTLERGAAQTAERLRKSIAAWSFLNPQGAEIRLTASVGLALYPLDAGTPPELVEAAKRCVTFAKSLGGNQLQVYRQLPTEDRPESTEPDQGRSTIVRSLAAAVDVRDRYTHSHSHLVSELSAATARALGLQGSEVSRVRIGGLLHDVGKIGIPDAILTKQGPLTVEEWTIIREHPVLGKRIVEQSPELADVVPMVLHHQERWDGSGYPDGLDREAIPLAARIIAAADAYHAIRSDRPYRSGRTHGEAVKELRRCAASQFDPRVIGALIECLDVDRALQSMPSSSGDSSSVDDRQLAISRPLKVVASKS